MRVRSQSPPPRQLPSQSMAAFAHSMAVPAGGGPVGTEFPRSPPTVLPLHIQDGRWASGGFPAEAGRGSHGAHSVSVQMLQSRRPASPPPGQMHAGRRLQPVTPPAGHPAGCLPGGPPPAAGGPPSPSTVQAYQQTMLQGSQVSPQHPVMPLPGNMVPPVVLPPPAPATCAVQCNTPGVPTAIAFVGRRCTRRPRGAGSAPVRPAWPAGRPPHTPEWAVASPRCTRAQHGSSSCPGASGRRCWAAAASLSDKVGMRTATGNRQRS
ncbi:unnamed protein product [Prorocentrum cordatum]|uniref:Uncharacterized protein n=1 Tax=Prorocentrum cordatum TaxID=2364126 RepID=A0ABN9VAG8_9DINO|nr:unnamed protein product [Polarella glacialis]